MTTTSEDPPAVRVSGVSKTYGSVIALDDVDLELRRGTVHGLVGENGSGKSTLTKIIAGVVTADRGTLMINGTPIDRSDPRASLAHGVRVIFQDLSLFPNLTVAENVAFEGDRSMFRAVSTGAMRRRAAAALDQLGLDIDPGTRLGDLSTAERQLVAIARAVTSQARIILMDEPTAALTHREIDRLLATMRGLIDQGLSFLFISHKLREVAAIADDLTVIRDGAVVASGPAADYSQERITELMTGGGVDESRRRNVGTVTAEPVLEVSGLSMGAAFSDVDLKLHRGRVLGLAGLVGSGRIEIGLSIAGLLPYDRGVISLAGRVARNLRDDPRLQYVPEDRLTEGLFLDWSIADNMITNNLDAALGPGGTLTPRRVNAVADRWRNSLRIKAPTVAAPASALSGGNQQRVLLARALAPLPEVIILNNPTIGVDIGSRSEIHALIHDVAAQGTAVLLISDEPAELINVCDEIVFVHDGRVVDRRDAATLDEDGLLDVIGSAGRKEQAR